MSTKELFLEIGTEEIPAGFLPKAMADMEAMIRKELENARLDFGEIKTLATPRRLALVVKGIPAVQPDAEITAMGPSQRASPSTPTASRPRPPKALPAARGSTSPPSPSSPPTRGNTWRRPEKRPAGRPTSCWPRSCPG